MSIFDPPLPDSGKVRDEEGSMKIEEDKEKDGVVANETTGDETRASKGG